MRTADTGAATSCEKALRMAHTKGRSLISAPGSVPRSDMNNEIHFGGVGVGEGADTDDRGATAEEELVGDALLVADCVAVAVEDEELVEVALLVGDGDEELLPVADASPLISLVVVLDAVAVEEAEDVPDAVADDDGEVVPEGVAIEEAVVVWVTKDEDVVVDDGVPLATPEVVPEAEDVLDAVAEDDGEEELDAVAEDDSDVVPEEEAVAVAVEDSTLVEDAELVDEEEADADEVTLAVVELVELPVDEGEGVFVAVAEGDGGT
jgi:hypothetical protein